MNIQNSSNDYNPRKNIFLQSTFSILIYALFSCLEKIHLFIKMIFRSRNPNSICFHKKKHSKKIILFSITKHHIINQYKN